MRPLLALMVTFGCAHPVTATGVKECWTTYYVIGVYHGCAEGPSWQQHIDDPNALRSARREIEPPPAVAAPTTAGFFCFASPKDDLIAGCARTRFQCAENRERATNDLAGVPECEHVDAAYCFGDTCMPTATGCVDRRSQVARQETPTCDERK